MYFDLDRMHIMATSSSVSQSEACASEENRQSDSDSESSESVSLAGKKRSRSSRRHINSKYQAQWSTKFLAIKRSSKGATFAFSSLCGVDISIAGGGVHQINSLYPIVPNGISALFYDKTYFWHARRMAIAQRLQ